MDKTDAAILSAQVKRNCDISDAKYWGNYTVCGLLLRLRELYRMEHGIMPWEAVPREEIGRWIGEREKLWEELEDREFRPLSLPGGDLDPFASEEINEVIEGTGLVYGAGFGLYMKPSFFLAALETKQTIEALTVYVSGREMVRDLSFAPAMLQGDKIFARRESMATLLWDKWEELAAKRSGPLVYAFRQYGLTGEEEPSPDLHSSIVQISFPETEACIHHEVGEAFEGKRLGEEWKRAVSGCRSRKVESFLRGLKDVLADTSEKGMLRHIIENDRKGSFGLYLAFHSGFSRLVFPEVHQSFQAFPETGDWGPVEEARKCGRERALGLASRVLEISEDSQDRTLADEQIERNVIGTLS